MRSIYWIIRYFIAQKHKDTLICTVNRMKKIHTPILLHLFGLELIEVSYSDPNANPNPYNFTGSRWLIRKKSKDFDMSQRLYTWRIQGDDKKTNKPMVMWENK